MIKTGCTMYWAESADLQREHGSRQVQSRWAYVKHLNTGAGPHVRFTGNIMAELEKALRQIQDRQYDTELQK